MVKFVYFDVGGVSIKDFSETNNWSILKKEIGINPKNYDDFEKLYIKYQREINQSLHINDFYKIVQNKFGLTSRPNFDFLTDGFVNKFSRNESIWPVIKLAKRYGKIGLLTNMWVGMLDKIVEKDLLPNIVWDVIIDSTRVHLQKPDLDIFQQAEKDSGTKRDEILFIDNSKKNLDTPAKLGWNTFFYNSTNYENSSKELLAFYKSLQGLKN